MKTQVQIAAEDRPDRLRRVPWAAVIVFVAVSFGFAWLVALPVWLMPADSPGYPVLFQVVAGVMMFTPALAVLAVVFGMKVPRGERLRFLGMWPLKPAKRVIWFTVGALFASILFVAASVALAAACGWLTLDLVEFSGFQEILQAQLAALGPDAAAEAASTMPPLGLLVAMQLLAIPIGALFNSILAFGEEIGWRGWLLPALRPLGVWPALLVSGVLWGVWHSPLILLGYNFGRTDWSGVALMIAGCIAWGVVFGWVRLRSASVWPTVVGHGALNASASMYLMLAAAGIQTDPALVSPLGVPGWIVLAVVVVILVLTKQFTREPELAPKATRLRQQPEREPEAEGPGPSATA